MSEGGTKVKADDCAAPLREEIKSAVLKLKEKGVTPLLVGFLASGDESARKYAEWTGKACESDGIKFELREVEKMELEDALTAANHDPSVHGIMIYYPCFGTAPSFYGGNMDDYLRDSVPIEKDVEGLCHTYRRNLYHNIRYIDAHTQANQGGILVESTTENTKKCLLPCTPLAIVKILEHLNAYDQTLPVGNRLMGKTIAVINRSEIVGRPLAAMLANDGAEVYSIDISSIYRMKRGKMVEVTEAQEELVKRSHIIVTGVPTKDYRLPTEWVSPGSVVFNVSHFKNVDEETLLKVPGVKYVPLVGKVTVAMLERNLLRLVQNYHS
ncbi:putative methylene tetrahydrofolate dehydrogenase [Baffinella frigidus]|nr:putative methylene tetrahydrofolate dehydrogenase [Cryptophyta sp. CCMP2293]|eukprot:CAMPEP_0180134606 /NCGR_PEP_ID=MMETSP0986-20121125/10267_1 /TAXON_ID=697907 /ORGANISM="non described non described, Strain CCMP2293" /LENGTH=325 /DNA_ID=CAMNT_0022075009 /DNA_START=34 /DNA_END=1011 /DNA_ORIENTATION=-